MGFLRCAVYFKTCQLLRYNAGSIARSNLGRSANVMVLISRAPYTQCKVLHVIRTGAAKQLTDSTLRQLDI